MPSICYAYLVQAHRAQRALDYVCYGGHCCDILCPDILAARALALQLQGWAAPATKHAGAGHCAASVRGALVSNAHQRAGAVRFVLSRHAAPKEMQKHTSYRSIIVRDCLLFLQAARTAREVAGARQASRMLGARAAVRAATTGARLYSFSRRARRQVAAAAMAGDGTLKVMLLHPLMGLDTLALLFNVLLHVMRTCVKCMPWRLQAPMNEVLALSVKPHLATECCAKCLHQCRQW